MEFLCERKLFTLDNGTTIHCAAMDALKFSTLPSLPRTFISPRNSLIVYEKPIFGVQSTRRASICRPLVHLRKGNFKISKAVSPAVHETQEPSPVDPEIELESKGEVFDWYANWYPVVPLCDLDKRRPQGKKVLGIDIVIWWDRNENAWKVFDDSCPHRLAPLSEGRIDQWGRLQCVYHGWCFGGGGDCKFIPQAPRDGPPVHTSKRACVAVYPSCVQNGLLWFWPNSDPKYTDIFAKKKPHYIPELDDPSYTNLMICRDIPFGYEILIENFMDPAHVTYAHYGILQIPEPPESLKADREGGVPLQISIHNLDVNGFTTKQGFGENVFVPPCLHYGYLNAGRIQQAMKKTTSAGGEQEGSTQKRALIISYCIPVSPGNSRLIFATPRNFGTWTERIIPRWISHISQNLILDGDLYLLHMEERKLMEVGSENWHKSCYVPTTSDAKVVAYRRWLNKYAGAGVDWRDKSTDQLPPTPSREQLMDRYLTHTASCSSCSVAHKQLQATDVVLQVLSVVLLGIIAASKQSGIKFIVMRYSLVLIAVLCFVASKWLKNFIYKTFQYHGYDHAFR